MPLNRRLRLNNTPHHGPGTGSPVPPFVKVNSFNITLDQTNSIATYSLDSNLTGNTDVNYRVVGTGADYFLNDTYTGVISLDSGGDAQFDLELDILNNLDSETVDAFSVEVYAPASNTVIATSNVVSIPLATPVNMVSETAPTIPKTYISGLPDLDPRANYALHTITPPDPLDFDLIVDWGDSTAEIDLLVIAGGAPGQDARWRNSVALGALRLGGVGGGAGGVVSDTLHTSEIKPWVSAGNKLWVTAGVGGVSAGDGSSDFEAGASRFGPLLLRGGFQTGFGGNIAPNAYTVPYDSDSLPPGANVDYYIPITNLTGNYCGGGASEFEAGGDATSDGTNPNGTLINPMPGAGGDGIISTITGYSTAYAGAGYGGSSSSTRPPASVGSSGLGAGGAGADSVSTATFPPPGWLGGVVYYKPGEPGQDGRVYVRYLTKYRKFAL